MKKHFEIFIPKNTEEYFTIPSITIYKRGRIVLNKSFFKQTDLEIGDKIAIAKVEGDGFKDDEWLIGKNDEGFPLRNYKNRLLYFSNINIVRSLFHAFDMVGKSHFRIQMSIDPIIEKGIKYYSMITRNIRTNDKI